MRRPLPALVGRPRDEMTARLVQKLEPQGSSYLSMLGLHRCLRVKKLETGSRNEWASLHPSVPEGCTFPPRPIGGLRPGTEGGTCNGEDRVNQLGISLEHVSLPVERVWC